MTGCQQGSPTLTATTSWNPTPADGWANTTIAPAMVFEPQGSEWDRMETLAPTPRPMRREASQPIVAQPRDNLRDAKAEKLFLGCLMSADNHSEAEQALRESRIEIDDFTEGFNRELFTLIDSVLSEGKTPNMGSLFIPIKLSTDPLVMFDHASGLPDLVGSFAAWPEYAEAIRLASATRETHQYSSGIADAVRRGNIGLAQKLAKELSELSLVRKQEDDGLPPIMDGYDLDQADIKTPPLLVSGLLHQGCKLAIGGGSKSYKTYVLLDLMLSVAYGKPWLGQDTTQGKVLYVNLELPPWSIRHRIQKIASAKGITLKPGAYDAWNLRGCAGGYREMIPKILDRIKGRDYRLVIFDPLYKMLGGADENSARDISDLLNHVEHIASTGPAIAFGSHFSKGNQSGKTSMDRISGSGVFARDPDSIMTITEHEDEDCYVAEFTLRNLPPLEKFGLRWEHPLFVPDDNLNPDSLKQSNAGRKKTHDPQKLLSYIRDTTKESPITVTKWAKRAKIHRSTLSGYLESMREAGYIGTVGDGIAARKYILQRGLGLLG